jgi:RHS repeat-associated protein
MTSKSIKQIFATCVALAVALLTLADPARSAATLTFLHTDVAGSPVAATDASGNVIWREGYRPYGERRLNQAPASGNRQFFHGKAFDPDSGLSYFGARYYDPLVGRFMGVDPEGFDQENAHSFNRYAYGNNNPFRYKDPNGRWAEDLVLAVPGIVVGSISLTNNLKEGRLSSAAVDLAGLAGDTLAAVVPGVPGGFGLAIAATRKIGTEVAEGVATSASTRAAEIQSVLSSRTQRSVTTAVAETKEGVRVVGSSEGRLRPAQRDALTTNEVAGVGQRGAHAEVNAVNAARSQGLTPTAVAPSRPACPGCQREMERQGISIIGP